MKARKAHSGDIERLAEIELSGDVRWGAHGLQQALEAENVLLLVAEVEKGEIAGFIATLIAAGEMQVQNIVVDKGFRRRGIGSFLLDFAFQQAGTDGASDAYLEVAAGNASAIALYEKYGFKQAGVRPGYYRNGDDAILMHKQM